jgi:hypothetical protein
MTMSTIGGLPRPEERCALIETVTQTRLTPLADLPKFLRSWVRHFIVSETTIPPNLTSTGNQRISSSFLILEWMDSTYPLASVYMTTYV